MSKVKYGIVYGLYDPITGELRITIARRLRKAA